MDVAAASEVFKLCDRELWLITACADNRQSGLIATNVSGASLVQSLPRVTVGLANHHYTRELIEETRSFCMHLIDETHIDWVWRFGIASGRNVDKLQGVAARSGVTGSPILSEARAWLDCRVESQLDTGDRTLYLAEVLDAGVQRLEPPLTAKRLVELAPADKLEQLKLAVEHDIELDRAAILEWRRQRG